MPKFFVSNNQIVDKVITIMGDDVKHIANVLRLQKGDKIVVGNKDTEVTYHAKIAEIIKEKVICEIIGEVKERAESNIEVTVFQGLPKGDKMEYIIQKTTELGVKKIVPVAMKRCIVKLSKQDESKKIARWQKIAEVAAKQSGRDIIPMIENITNVVEIKEKIQEYDLFLVAYEEEKVNTLKNELKNIQLPNMTENIESKAKENITGTFLKIGVVIGPEGGLERQEVEDLKMNGAKIITLGNRILRTETASLAVLSNIMYEFEV